VTGKSYENQQLCLLFLNLCIILWPTKCGSLVLMKNSSNVLNHFSTVLTSSKFSVCGRTLLNESDDIDMILLARVGGWIA